MDAANSPIVVTLETRASSTCVVYSVVGPVEAFLARAFALSNRARKRHLHYRYLRRGHRRAVRALGCRLSGSTPSRTVGSSYAPLNQLSPVRHCHAIRLASGPSSARDRRRDLHGRIAPCGEMLRWPL